MLLEKLSYKEIFEGEDFPTDSSVKEDYLKAAKALKDYFHENDEEAQTMHYDNEQ